MAGHDVVGVTDHTGHMCKPNHPDQTQLVVHAHHTRHTPLYRPLPFRFCTWPHYANWTQLDSALDMLDVMMNQHASNTSPANKTIDASNTSNTGTHSLVVWDDQTSQNDQDDQDDQDDQNDQNDQNDSPDQNDPDGLADQPAWNYPMWLHLNIGNGFWMQCVRPTHPADPETVQQVVELWQQNQAMTIQQFCDKFDHVACSDWSKMQPDGEPFGGAWDLDDLDDPDGSTAWDLTRYQNFVCLAKMPFPRQCLLYAVDYLCSFRCESPVQVKDWLEWIRSHVEATHQLDLVQHDMHELEEFARLKNVVNIQAMFDKYDI